MKFLDKYTCFTLVNPENSLLSTYLKLIYYLSILLLIKINEFKYSIRCTSSVQMFAISSRMMGKEKPRGVRKGREMISIPAKMSRCTFLVSRTFNNQDLYIYFVVHVVYYIFFIVEWLTQWQIVHACSRLRLYVL